MLFLCGDRIVFFLSFVLTELSVMPRRRKNNPGCAALTPPASRHFISPRVKKSWGDLSHWGKRFRGIKIGGRDGSLSAPPDFLPSKAPHERT